MYTPRLQYANQPVLRPKRAMTTAAPQRQTKDVSPKQNDSSLNSIFRRLVKNNPDQE
ncbi:hypothetical protein [Undibacterium sp. KW1]|uniref:hypothetical protein n=1 Tax=Undibacterium sp. KW1 TaxID=2058624 RepID=UPI00138A17AB|nr:hypothetical protein [Undibacterium sp. KW1]